ncbi:MAG: hypothetical protein LBD45_00830, partial [Bacteroidales bacterium]|nr:hypothetical protein [Bacteroidales bacterium]
MKKYLILSLLFGMSLTLFSQERLTGKCIKGDCQNGDGSFQFDNGDKYTGAYRNGQRNGEGTYIYKSGDRYTGTWSNNQMNGYGEYYGVNYDYKGKWANNQQHGQGTIHFKTGKRAGDSYTGQFVNSRPQGKNGVYTYRDGSDKIKYEGDFERGKFNGEGTLTYRDNSEDEGMWKDDVFLGAEIGVYLKQPVLKKGDTVITQSNNNKYLLSQQTIMKNDKYQMEELNESIFAIEKDTKNNRKLIG